MFLWCLPAQIFELQTDLTVNLCFCAGVCFPFFSFLWCLGGALCWPFRLQPNHAFPTLICLAWSHVAVFFVPSTCCFVVVLLRARRLEAQSDFKSLVTLPELNACSVALMPRVGMFSTHLEVERCCSQEKSQSLDLKMHFGLFLIA